MSTKTTFKRVAAVAAAALAIGGVSAVSAHAASTALTAGNTIVYAWTGDGLATGDNGVSKYDSGFGLAAGNGVAGPVNTVQVQLAAKAGNITAGSVWSTGTDKRVIVTVSGAGATITAADAGTINTAGSQVLVAANNSDDKITIATPQAGAVTVNVYQEGASGIFGATAAETVTFTINATASAGTFSAANSTVYDTTTVGSAATASLTTAPTVAGAVSADTPVIRYTWSLKDATSAAYSLSSTKTASVVVSGPGLISTTNNSSASASKVLSLTSGSSGSFYVYGDGSSGTATVTFSVGSVVVATKTYKTYSTTVASLTAAKVATNVVVSAHTGYAALTATDLETDGIGTISVVAKDAQGNAISSPSGLTAKSSDTTIATVGSVTWNATDKVSYVTATGVKAGKATITVSNAAGTVTASADILVTTDVAATVALTFDQDSYEPGQKVTYSLSAKNADGNVIADGTYTGFLAAALAKNQAIVSDPAILGTAVVFQDGVATGTFYAPSNSVTLTGKTGTSLQLATAVQGVAITGTAVVSSASTAAAQAAIDAAQEATDAANAAYDAANNAMDSADAATAAAQDAADNASAALAAVTSLSATVAKLVKSVAAIAAALAKVQKKIGA